MDSRELSLWQTAYRLGLFGSQREEWIAGKIAAAAANAPHFKKSGGGMWSAADIFPGLRPKRTWEERQKEIKSRLRSWRRTWGVGK